MVLLVPVFLEDLVVQLAPLGPLFQVFLEDLAVQLALLALLASDKLRQLYREKREIVNAKAAAKQCEVNKNGEEKTV